MGAFLTTFQPDTTAPRMRQPRTAPRSAVNVFEVSFSSCLCTIFSSVSLVRTSKKGSIAGVTTTATLQDEVLHEHQPDTAQRHPPHVALTSGVLDGRHSAARTSDLWQHPRLSGLPQREGFWCKGQVTFLAYQNFVLTSTQEMAFPTTQSLLTTLLRPHSNPEASLAMDRYDAAKVYSVREGFATHRLHGLRWSISQLAHT